MTLFQYIDSNIERTSPSKSVSWKRKHYNALQAVKAYCNNKDVELVSILIPGWIDSLKEYYSNPELFSESTSRQYKDIFKSLYASAVNTGLLPPIKLNHLCKEGWDEREEQNYKSFDFLSQIKILDYKNLDKEQSNLRDLYLISMASMGTEFSSLLSLDKSALEDDILNVDGLKFKIPPLLIEKINLFGSKSDKLLPIKSFYKGEAKDPVKALKLKIRNLFKSLNLNLYQNEDTFIDWLIVAKEAGVSVEALQHIIAIKDLFLRNYSDNHSNNYKKDLGQKLEPTTNQTLEKAIEYKSTSSENQTEALSSTFENNGENAFFDVQFSEEDLTQLVFNVTERLEVTTSNWYLVRILKNKLTGEQLVKKLKKDGIITLKPSDYYAPIYKIKTIRNGVTKIVNSSDTDKMLFVRTSLKQAQRIERIDEGGVTIARNIRGGKYAIIPFDELQRMRNFLEGSNKDIFLLQNSDYIGRKIEVTSGSYAGWKGEIIKKSTSAIQHGRKNELNSLESDQFKEDYDNTIFIVQFLNSLKWAIPVSGLEFKFID